MNNDELDKLFRDKINEAATISKPATDWDTFAKKLYQAEGFTDPKFDANIKSKVAEYNIPFNNKHWEILKQRLIKEENLKRKIFITSIVESAALLVLLFLFQQYDNDLNNQYSLPKDFVSNSKKENPMITAADLTTLYSHKAFEYESSTINQKNAIIEEELIDIESQNLSSEETSPLISKKEINLYPVAAIAKELNDLLIINISIDKKNLDEKINLDKANDQQNIDRIAIQDATNNQKIEEVTLAKKRSLMNIPSLTERKFDIADVVLPSSIKYKETDAMQYIIPVIGFGQGIIKSSYDKIYNLKAYTIYSSQVTTGVFYGYKKRGVELLSGLRYTKKAYNPQRISELYYDQSNSPYRVSLEKIKYDIIEVPLQFKAYFKQSPVINFYAKVGSSLNITLSSRYDVNDKDLSFNSFAAKSIATTSDGEIISNNAKLSKKEFNPGWLQNGGKLNENAFLTVTGELGLERRINMSNHIIIGAEYAKYFMIEGIGPNNDKFNAININIGLKHKIK